MPSGTPANRVSPRVGRALRALTLLLFASGLGLARSAIATEPEGAAAAASALGDWILSIQLQGNGFGNVASTPGTINCGSQGASCTNQFANGTSITLLTVAEPDSEFVGWNGDPPCAGGSFSIVADTVCIAHFALIQFDSIFANGFEHAP